jgi:hypothetical protein
MEETSKMKKELEMKMLGRIGEACVNEGGWVRMILMSTSAEPIDNG